MATSEIAAPSATVTTRTRWRDFFSAPLLIVGVTLFIIAADNDSFWNAAWHATTNDEHRIAILCSLFMVVLVPLITVLTLTPARLLRAVAATLLVIAASCSYFMTQYGVVIDQSMIRNAVETTVLEATPLLSPAYFWQVALHGVLPAIVVATVPLGRPRWQSAVIGRLGVISVTLAIAVATLYANYAAVSFFGRENDGLRLKINPAYPLYAAATFGISTRTVAAQDRAPLEVRLRGTGSSTGKPMLLVLVVGETARADRFSFNGYQRDTNRYTRAHDVVNFPSVISCGTSTAESVPCMFSGLGRAGFSHDAAARRESVFGALQRLGVSTFWRDNSTGCKDVCDAEHFEERATWTDAQWCDSTGCFDELLLKDFDALVADRSRDHLIVLHQRGSHGPAYHTDVPQKAKEFFPECNLPNLRNCDRAAINNAYDNTILYTDYFLSRVIEELEQRADEFATAMLYVSDHGESLGENGLYLHGFPYAMAPREQIEVPMLLWGSASFFAERARVDAQCLGRSAERPTTHDAIFHTLLPLFGVQSPLYDEALDLFAACRGSKLTATGDR